LGGAEKEAMHESERHPGGDDDAAHEGVDTTADLIAGWLGGAGESLSFSCRGARSLTFLPASATVGVLVGNPFEASRLELFDVWYGLELTTVPTRRC
jgi:hypothetical protein